MISSDLAELLGVRMLTTDPSCVQVNLLVPRMKEFIGFVETMGEVDQADEGSFATLSCGNDFLREDNAENFANVAAVMENMPVEEGHYLRVPKVGEDEA